MSLGQRLGRRLAPEPPTMEMKLPTPVWQDAKSGYEVLSSQVEGLKTLLSALDLKTVEAVGELLDQRRRQGRTVYCTGNGGSAATASHVAADLSQGHRIGNEMRPRVISLVANAPMMTALANDVGYANVFVEQLEGLFREDDVVIAISASGNSENVLRAVQFANDHGGTSVALVGFDGGKLKDKCDFCIHVPTPVGAYEIVEDVHHAVCHMLANYLKFKALERVAADAPNA